MSGSRLCRRPGGRVRKSRLSDTSPGRHSRSGNTVVGQLARLGQRLPVALFLVLALMSASLSDSARGSTLQQTPTLGCNATSNFFFTTLTSLQESPVPSATGPITNPTGPSTLPGNGLATALLDPTGTQLRVTLSYQNLTSAAQRYHIHQLATPQAPNTTV